jgi:hypothetical protein
MSDVVCDPYEGLETYEERQAVYQELLEKHKEEKAECSRQQGIYDSFSKDWEHYRKIELRENREFYKYVSMFAAGSFGVSFAFIDTIIPLQAADYKLVLAGGWACFAAALVFSLIIHLVSSFIHGKYCDVINENTQRAYEGKSLLGYKEWYTTWVISALYVLDFICFLGGMACLVGFVFLNV